MSKKGSKNIVSIGFIDLLTGFLCSTAVLMIIIKYGASLGGDIAGGTKEFFFYSATIEYENLNDRTNPDLEDVLFQIMINKNGEWIESEIQSDGMAYDSGFINFNDRDVYGIGPSIKVGESNTAYYHVYGSAELKSLDRLQVGLRYYSNRQLDNKSSNLSDDQLKEIANTQFIVSHKIEHILSQSEVDATVDTLGLGEEVFLKVNIEEANNDE